MFYRARQFWFTLRARPKQGDLSQAHTRLPDELLALFLRMQPSEQAHGLKIYNQLLNQGETHPDLLAAALLHDVGKSQHPLQLWERVLIVLSNWFFPRLAVGWGEGVPVGWKRAYVVARQHPAWGAEMVSKAGASSLLTNLVRRHQEGLNPTVEHKTQEDLLLHRLKILDDQN